MKHALLKLPPAPLPGPIDGGPKRDLLDGTADADTIRGLGGNDVLRGLEGVDSLYGGDGRDRLFGDGGPDRLFGGKGDDQLYGDDGSDRLDGGKGSDAAFGGAGVDRFILSEGADTLTGGLGLDILDASQFGHGAILNLSDVRQGYSDDAENFVSIAADTVQLSDGTLQSVTEIESVIGSAFRDQMWTSAEGVAMSGLAGDDRLTALGDGSSLLGGDGSDNLNVSGSDAVAHGDAGNDFLGSGFLNGAVTLYGDDGDDTLRISGGPSSFYGGNGNDTIVFLHGDDNFDFPAGYKVYGGTGADVFDFGNNGGRVADFTPGEDRIDISWFVGSQNLTFGELQGMLVAGFGGTVLELDTDTTSGYKFGFVGVTPDQFSADDFILHA